MDNPTTYQAIPDPCLNQGFWVLSQKDHQNGDAVRICGKISPSAQSVPLWYLATWDSGSCIWDNRVVSDSPLSISDGHHRRFFSDPTNGILSFLLDTEAYYQGTPARKGDYWPHLLIETSSLGAEAVSCDASRICLSLDIRLTEYECHSHPEDWVEAAQFLLYFYLRGKKTNDFIWFGVQLFDSRTAYGDAYCAMDGGKADASGSLIYSIGLSDVYLHANGNHRINGKISPSLTWLPIRLDLKPHLESVFAIAKEKNLISSASLSEMKLDGLNLGWETIGTFRHEMQVRNLKLLVQ